MPSNDIALAKGREDQLVAAFKAKGFTLSIGKKSLTNRDPTYTVTSDKTGGSDSFDTQAEIFDFLKAAGFKLADDTNGKLALVPYDGVSLTNNTPQKDAAQETGGKVTAQSLYEQQTGKPWPPTNPGEYQFDANGKLIPGSNVPQPDEAEIRAWVALADSQQKASAGFASQNEARTWAYNNGLVDKAKWAANQGGAPRLIDGYVIELNPSTNRFEIKFKTPAKPATTYGNPEFFTDPTTGQRYQRSGPTDQWTPVTEPKTAAQPSLQAQIDAAVAKGDMQEAQRLYNFQNQESLRDQALRIGQSPGDWWTYYSRLYGTQPSIDYKFGAEPVIPGRAGGLLDDNGQFPSLGSQGGQKPALGANSVAMDRYQSGLDAQRNQRGADGLTTEERIRRQAGLQDSRGRNINPAGASVLGGATPGLSIGQRERQGSGGTELDAIDRQIQGLVGAGDQAQTPEEQAQIEQQIQALQQQRQQVWQRQQQGNQLGGGQVVDAAREGTGGGGLGASSRRTMDFRTGRDDIDPATGRPYRENAGPPAPGWGRSPGGGYTFNGQSVPSRISPQGGFSRGIEVFINGQWVAPPSNVADNSGDTLNLQGRFGGQGQGSGLGTQTGGPLAPNDPWQGWNAAHGFAPAPGDTGKAYTPLGQAGGQQMLGSSEGQGLRLPSHGLEQVLGGGQVTGQRLIPGATGAPMFASPQTLGGLTESEQAIRNAEIQKYTYLPDYQQQQRKQMGGFGGGTAGAGYRLGGGSRGVAGRSLGSRY